MQSYCRWHPASLFCKRCHIRYAPWHSILQPSALRLREHIHAGHGRSKLIPSIALYPRSPIVEADMVKSNQPIKLMALLVVPVSEGYSQ
jgi:hypothetical protein